MSMLDEISKLHSDMRELTIAAGVKIDNYNNLASEISETTPIEVKNIVLEFLIELIKNEYKEMLDIWNLLKPDIWERYKTFNITGLREQILLDDAKSRLRKKWRAFMYKWNSLKPK